MRGWVVALALAATPAHAAHYMVADVADVIPEEHHAALARAGVANTAVLYERLVTRAGRASLAAATGIAVARLDEWAAFLDLMQLDGVGPTMVRVLNAAGVPNLAVFQTADASILLPKMRAANVGNRLSQVLPPVDVVKAWIDAARRVKVRLER